MRHLEPRQLTRMRAFARAARRWTVLAHPFGNNRGFILRSLGEGGQALVELAIFGTVLLFCLTLLLRYGMNANYQQRVSQQTFRKAFVRARSYEGGSEFSRPGQAFNPGWSYETGSPPAVSDHGRFISYIVVEDKPVLSASGILPILERAPVAASAEAVWSIDLFGESSGGQDEPRTEFEINGRRYSFVANTLADGGLQGYDKTTQVDDSSFLRREDTSGITTTDSIDAQEIFSRSIGGYDVSDTFSQQETETWQTPNE